MKRKAPKKVREAPKDLSRAVDELSWIVQHDEHEQRLDRYLAKHLDWRSRTSIVELLQAGQVKVAGEVVTKKSFRVRAGRKVAVAVPPPPEPERHEELAAELEQAILYEDPDLIALHKPPGLVVHPVGRTRVNTLIQALHWRFRHGVKRDERVVGGSRPGELGPVIPRVCHRLDKDTSGAIVFAKNARARTHMQLLIEGHEIEKVYLACVHGVPEPREGRIELPLGADTRGERDLQVCVREDGARARTDFSLEEARPPFAWVRFRLHTGRQHQIRVHSRALGHPLLCDPVYGRGEQVWPPEQPLLARQALHAWRLRFELPGGEELALEAPLPPDLAALRAWLAREPGPR